MSLKITAAMSALLAAAAAVPGFSACVSADEPATTDPRPNIVLIVMDDARFDDVNPTSMPNTMRLLGGDNGARYLNSYASTPLCCPGRATLLTGQYSHNTGVYGNSGPHGGVDALDDSSTVATWLQSDGYNTAFLGKYLNGYGVPTDGVEADYVPPGWDEWVATPKPTTSDYTDFDLTIGSSTPDASSVGEIRHQADGYQTRNFTNRAVTHIEETFPGDDPAFMFLSFFAPHAGHGDYPSFRVPAEPQYRGTSTVGLPRSPAVGEEQVADKPPWIENLPELTDQRKQEIVTQRRERRDALMSVDQGVEELVDALRATGELDNTIIMLTSDNGWMMGEHGIWKEKTVPYMEAAKVPLLIRGPGFTPGTHSEPVSNVDIATTVADLAGVTPGHAVDGMSLLGPVPADRPILLEYLGPVADSWSWIRIYSSIVQNGTQYTEYNHGRELYDLEADPWQQWNRIAAAGMRSSKQGLAGILDQLRDCVGSGCRP